jgi:MFS family permease
VIESGVSPAAGRLSDRFGARRPVLIGLAAGTLFGVLVWLPVGLGWLIAVLVLGTPFFGSLYTPAAAMVSESAEDQQLNHGIAFALTNFTWATGQSPPRPAARWPRRPPTSSPTCCSAPPAC